ncbi:unnamed protein product, partial [Ascophyllum nodosum]
RIASWRGGAIESETARPQAMNAQLGLIRAAGYAMIAGSVCLKTPQIARVWRARSLVGLAPASIYADVFLFATNVMYHVLKKNPFRAYGESVIILLQTIVMVALMWRFGVDEVAVSSTSGRMKSSSAISGEKKPTEGGMVGRTAIVLGSATAVALTMQYLPDSMWGWLIIASTPAILAVQLPQIYKNYRQKHTGELAVLTVFLAMLGSLVRTWTTLADLGGDPWLMFNYSLGLVTNAILLAQMWTFRFRTADVRRAVEVRSHPVAPAA